MRIYAKIAIGALMMAGAAAALATPADARVAFGIGIAPGYYGPGYPYYPYPYCNYYSPYACGAYYGPYWGWGGYWGGWRGGFGGGFRGGFHGGGGFHGRGRR